jgi:hypothetical protein
MVALERYVVVVAVFVNLHYSVARLDCRIEALRQEVFSDLGDHL